MRSKILFLASCLICITGFLTIASAQEMNGTITLQIFYNNNQNNISVTQNNCINRVIYCVNGLLRSASTQLPLKYKISAINYNGPVPANTQQVIYNNHVASAESCNVGAILSEAVAKKKINNVLSLELMVDPMTHCK
jgi:hypothetical protein